MRIRSMVVRFHRGDPGVGLGFPASFLGVHLMAPGHKGVRIRRWWESDGFGECLWD